MAEVVLGYGGAEKKVMLAIDESEYSYYALTWVLDNLKESLNKSPLLIFMAQLPTKNAYTFAASLGSARMYCPVSATQEFNNSVKENQNKLTLALLEKAKEICASRGVNAETLTEVGDPQTAICNAVEKLNINLLILGERGLGKIKSKKRGLSLQSHEALVLIQQTACDINDCFWLELDMLKVKLVSRIPNQPCRSCPLFKFVLAKPVMQLSE